MLPTGVKVFFVGCRPSVASQSLENSDDEVNAYPRQLWDAIHLEKLVYGDLLTDELDCDDTYSGLGDKVKEFLHFTATHYAHAQYVMIADDDLYAEKPNRINSSMYRYVLSKEQYPFSKLPPFAIGAYIFLSMDCAQFISKNRRRLRDLDGMDDMSMALWLMVIQVHAKPFGRLEHLRGGPCSDNLVALGDLSPLSIRVVHDNVLAQRRLCHGFDRYTWFKPK
ncbi:hypothetical protein BBJ29_003625 [Phytophthora kernoviae]|uniref:Hexosyltransferase n=1 Tax=Phytophthora kernoviae TaxID=325452 RepID=A0A3F2RLV1_9STRA|nr:hypothetical protein BBP00_00006206 [Phytophthora kernoviae]RLN62953.1 hypothetical protein BBJ29_003625 [Phytophthora kernoviae]